MNILYTTDTCAYCPGVKKFLKAKGIPYEEVNVTEDVKLLKPASDVSGMFTVPQLLTEDGKVIVGPKWAELGKLA